MSDENKPDVEIRPDHGIESFGKSAYFAVNGGDSQSFRISVFAMLGVVTLIFVGMLFSKDPAQSPQGQTLTAPGIALSNSALSSKLLTERDLTNVIARQRVDSSLLGKIKVVSLRGTSELPIGSEMHAVLASGASDGIVKATLTESLNVDSESLLPERTVLFGKGRSGNERLFIEFNKAILPTGESYPIRGQAFDGEDRILGLKGTLVGTRTKKMAGAMAFGFLGGMAEGLQTSGGSFLAPRKPSVRDAALSGASRAALGQSEAYMDEIKNSPNTIEVKVGTRIIVITDEPKGTSDGQ